MASRRPGGPPPLRGRVQPQIIYVQKDAPGCLSRPVSGCTTGCLFVSIFGGLFISYIVYVSPSTPPSPSTANSSSSSSGDFFVRGEEAVVYFKPPATWTWIGTTESTDFVHDAEKNDDQKRLRTMELAGEAAIIRKGDRFDVVDNGPFNVDVKTYRKSMAGKTWRVPREFLVKLSTYDKLTANE